MMKHDRRERHLGSIDNHLRSIAKNIEMDGLKKVLKMESRERVLDVLKQHGPLSVNELASETGMPALELAMEVRLLNRAGAVACDVDREEIIDEENFDVEIRPCAVSPAGDE